ncbi:glycosyltransferase N-terminal domain-containing protein [Komagataeibacter oboediens]
MGTGPCGAVLAAAWWGVASLLPPFLRLNLRRRLTRGRETSDSVPQRRGIASRASRPPGPLIWLHAASVGESVALLPVISQLLAISPTHTILVTTGTVTGAGIMQARPACRACTAMNGSSSNSRRWMFRAGSRGSSISGDLMWQHWWKANSGPT